MLKITEMGLEYVGQTRAKTERGLVRAFENVLGNIYSLDKDFEYTTNDGEITHINKGDYVGNNLTIKARIQIMISDGFIEEV